MLEAKGNDRDQVSQRDEGCAECAPLCSYAPIVEEEVASVV